MEYLSVKVAKVIKEIGYPFHRFQTVSRQQFEAGHGYKYSTDKSFYSESPSILYPEDKDTIDMYYNTTYIDVWLWLYREKKINVTPSVISGTMEFKSLEGKIHNDPEDAIIESIEYLVTNDLIK